MSLLYYHYCIYHNISPNLSLTAIYYTLKHILAFAPLMVHCVRYGALILLFLPPPPPSSSSSSSSHPHSQCTSYRPFSRRPYVRRVRW